MAFRPPQRPFGVARSRTEDAAQRNRDSFRDLVNSVSRPGVEALIRPFWCAEPLDELHAAFADPAELVEEYAPLLCERGQDPRKLAESIRAELKHASGMISAEGLAEEVELARAELVREWIGLVSLAWTRGGGSVAFSPDLVPRPRNHDAPSWDEAIASSDVALASAVAIPAEKLPALKGLLRDALRTLLSKGPVPLVDGLVLVRNARGDVEAVSSGGPTSPPGRRSLLQRLRLPWSR